MRRKAFYAIYAICFFVVVGITSAMILHFRQSSMGADSNIHAKIQLDLYVKSVKSAMLLCLRKKDLSACQTQTFLFSPYIINAILSPIHNNAILLDIHAQVQIPSSKNTLRKQARYIIIH